MNSLGSWINDPNLLSAVLKVLSRFNVQVLGGLRGRNDFDSKLRSAFKIAVRVGGADALTAEDGNIRLTDRQSIARENIAGFWDNSENPCCLKCCCKASR